MKPFVIVEDASAMKAILEILCIFIAIFIFVADAIGVKIWICICLLVILAVRIQMSRSKMKEEVPDKIFLKIDEQGITFRSMYEETSYLVKWQDIKNVEVTVSDSSSEVWIYRKKGSPIFNRLGLSELGSHGFFTYYIFRHKLKAFADDKKKIKCPLTTLG